MAASLEGSALPCLAGSNIAGLIKYLPLRTQAALPFHGDDLQIPPGALRTRRVYVCRGCMPYTFSPHTLSRNPATLTQILNRTTVPRRDRRSPILLLSFCLASPSLRLAVRPFSAGLVWLANTPMGPTKGARRITRPITLWRKFSPFLQSRVLTGIHDMPLYFRVWCH